MRSGKCEQYADFTAVLRLQVLEVAHLGDVFLLAATLCFCGNTPSTAALDLRYGAVLHVLTNYIRCIATIESARLSLLASSGVFGELTESIHLQFGKVSDASYMLIDTHMLQLS